MQKIERGTFEQGMALGIRFFDPDGLRLHEPTEVAKIVNSGGVTVGMLPDGGLMLIFNQSICKRTKKGITMPESLLDSLEKIEKSFGPISKMGF